jgi:DNA-binding NtrC family response regulator
MSMNRWWPLKPSDRMLILKKPFDIIEVLQLAISLTEKSRLLPEDGPATIQVLMRMNPKVRIIAASGQSVKDMVAKATSAGVTDFISKPYAAETLLRKLHAVVNMQRTTSRYANETKFNPCPA